MRRLLPVLGHLPLARLGPSGVQATYDALLASGLSPRSVEQTHLVLHRALYQALHWGLIACNPTELVAPPRPKRREMTALTAGELQRLLDSTRGDRWYPLWVVLSTTGLRIGEALALSWDRVDIEAGRLLVVRSLQRQRGKGLVFAEPKTMRSRRLVYLSRPACQALDGHRRRQANLSVSNGSSSDLVFANRNGEPQDSGSVTTALKALLTALASRTSEYMTCGIPWRASCLPQASIRRWSRTCSATARC